MGRPPAVHQLGQRRRPDDAAHRHGKEKKREEREKKRKKETRPRKKKKTLVRLTTTPTKKNSSSSSFSQALIWDRKFRPHVHAYAKDEALFFQDFAKAFSKLLELGVPRGGAAAAASPRE